MNALNSLRGALETTLRRTAIWPRRRESGLAFTVRVREDSLDGGYIAECVELPGCMSQGDTEAEAIENVVEAITGVLAVRMHKTAVTLAGHLPVRSTGEEPGTEHVHRVPVLSA